MHKTNSFNSSKRFELTAFKNNFFSHVYMLCWQVVIKMADITEKEQ